MEQVYTVGYQDRTVDEFIVRLKENRIQVLIDVREIPASRKKGFSKKGLSESLSNAGITYIHAKLLGSPKHLREKLHEDNDYNSFRHEYKKHLEDNIQVLSELYKNIICSSTACLMCMERLPSECHRSIVAERVKELNGNGLVIRHI